MKKKMMKAHSLHLSSVRRLGIKWILKNPAILFGDRLFCGTSGIHMLSVNIDIFV